MSKFKSIFLILTLFLFAATSLCLADSIPWDAIDQGGGIRNPDGYQLLDASGQGAIGKISIPDHYTLYAGYILPISRADTIPAAPTNLIATAISSSQINLTWQDKSNNEDSFKIERKVEGETYSEIATVSANTTTYLDPGLSQGTTYCYRVKAYNSAGDSGYSNEACTETFTASLVYLTIDDAKGAPEETDVPVVISLDNLTDNNTPVASMQFRIKYDPSIGIHANGNYNLTSRTQGFNTTVTVNENGPNSEVLVLLFNTSGKTISPGTGSIFELLFNIDPDANEDDTSILEFTECLVSDVSANPIPSDSADKAIFTIESPCALGDINCDGAVNIFDVQILINVITGSETDSDRIALSDLNDDGVVNIFDLQLLINIIISGGNGAPPNSTSTIHKTPSMGSSPSITLSAQMSNGSNTLILPDIQLQQNEENTFGLGLSNVDVVASGQIRFTYNSTIGFEITGAGLTSRTSGYADPVFQVDDSDPANVEVLVLFYTFGSQISSGTGDILEFDYETTTDGQGTTALTFIESLLSDQSAGSLPVTSQDGNASFEMSVTFLR
ncbi:fibronectin type III domain-containing protein [bacterium]|nr:fibronectin type III domain-containing protein [bacterium]MBU1616113.1 fibronectin type III domain-containing protein [bacterium]